MKTKCVSLFKHCKEGVGAKAIKVKYPDKNWSYSLYFNENKELSSMHNRNSWHASFIGVKRTFRS